MTQADPVADLRVDRDPLTDAGHARGVVRLHSRRDRDDPRLKHLAERLLVEDFDARLDSRLQLDTTSDEGLRERAGVLTAEAEVRVAEADAIAAEHAVQVLDLVDDGVDVVLPPREPLDLHVGAHRTADRTPPAGLHVDADLGWIAGCRIARQLEQVPGGTRQPTELGRLHPPGPPLGVLALVVQLRTLERLA